MFVSHAYEAQADQTAVEDQQRVAEPRPRRIVGEQRRHLREREHEDEVEEELERRDGTLEFDGLRRSQADANASGCEAAGLRDEQSRQGAGELRSHGRFEARVSRPAPGAERAVERPEVVEEPGIAAVDGSGAMHEIGYAAAGDAPVTRTSDPR